MWRGKRGDPCGKKRLSCWDRVCVVSEAFVDLFFCAES